MDTNTQRGAVAAPALLAGVAFCVLAGIHATHGTFDERLTSAVDYANDGAFTVALLGSALALLGLFGRTRPAVVAAVGAAIVAVGVAPALITGESPEWFAAAGVPGNLLWLAGTVWLGVRAFRERLLPRPAAVALALTVPFGLIGGEAGGGIVPGVLFLYLGLRQVRVTATPAAAPRPAGRPAS